LPVDILFCGWTRSPVDMVFCGWTRWPVDTVCCYMQGGANVTCYSMSSATVARRTVYRTWSVCLCLFYPFPVCPIESLHSREHPV
jgi:hypothetical protein